MNILNLTYPRNPRGVLTPPILRGEGVEMGTLFSFLLEGTAVDLNNMVPPETYGPCSSPHRNEGASSDTLST